MCLTSLSPMPKPIPEPLAMPGWPPLLWLVSLVVVVYANSWWGVFQFDDYNVIVDLDSVHSLSAWWLDGGQGIRPVLKLSYALNWVSGLGVAGFHGVNLAIHALTTGVVFQLMRRLLVAWNVEGPRNAWAWTGAALFAVHPAHTEAVTYICGRSSSLMALLYLTGLNLHLGASKQRQKWAKWGVPACFVMALGVKETAVTFPLALLLTDLSCGGNWKASCKREWRSWAVLLLALAVFVMNDAYRATMVRSLEFNTPAGSLATQLAALPYFLRQYVLPLWLNIDPDLTVQQDFSGVLPGVVLLGCFAAIGVHFRRSQPWIAFALAWFVLHVLPLHALLPRLDVANDRQLYLASWPLNLALCVVVVQWLPTRLARTALGIWIAGWAVLGLVRNQDYSSEVALWEQTVLVSPQKSRAHNNLGFAYAQAGRAAEARREYLVALRLDPSNIKARLNLRRMNAELSGRQPTP